MKFTDEEIAQIYEDYVDGSTLKELADKYGLKIAQVTTVVPDHKDPMGMLPNQGN